MSRAAPSAPLRHARSTIAAAAAGLRLDLWLADRFTYRSRQQWRRSIERGEIRLNGTTAKASRRLQLGDAVEYCLPAHDEPPVDADFTVLVDDPDCLVIAKPGNLPCHPAGVYFQHTLWHLVTMRWPEARLVNRLDRETSGIVLVARNAASAGLLTRQFAERRVRKSYLAIVEGHFPESAEADGVLVDDGDSAVHKKRRFLADPAADGETAQTAFRRLAVGNDLSLVAATPRTGRLHQIRATLNSLGYPVVGDKIYGVDDRYYLDFIAGQLAAEARQRLRLSRQALHAWQLRWVDAAGAARLAVAPLPADMATLAGLHGLQLPEAETL